MWNAPLMPKKNLNLAMVRNGARASAKSEATGREKTGLRGQWLNQSTADGFQRFQCVLWRGQSRMSVDLQARHTADDKFRTWDYQLTRKKAQQKAKPCILSRIQSDVRGILFARTRLEAKLTQRERERKQLIWLLRSGVDFSPLRFKDAMMTSIRPSSVTFRSSSLFILLS